MVSGRMALLTLAAMFGLGFAAFCAFPLVHQDHLPELPAPPLAQAAGGDGTMPACAVVDRRAGRAVYPLPCPGLRRQGLGRLKVAARQATKPAPLYHIHVGGAHMTGPTPGHVEGIVVWRTVFGVPAGITAIDGTDFRSGWDHRRAARTWGAFLPAEPALGALLAWQRWNAP